MKQSIEHHSRFAAARYACLCAFALVVSACSRSEATAPQETEAEVGSVAPAEKAAPAPAPETCAACEQRSCRNFRGQGVDLVKDCLENADAKLAAACKVALECGRSTKCGLGTRGAEECYCGHATTEQCAKGTGIDGVCKAQFEAAAGNADATFVTTHFGERSLALGNAVFMLQCDSEQCREACTR